MLFLLAEILVFRIVGRDEQKLENFKKCFEKGFWKSERNYSS